MVNEKKERNNVLKFCMSAIAEFSVGNFLQMLTGSFGT
jgi:hypothetical protein